MIMCQRDDTVKYRDTQNSSWFFLQAQSLMTSEKQLRIAQNERGPNKFLFTVVFFSFLFNEIFMWI